MALQKFNFSTRVLVHLIFLVSGLEKFSAQENRGCFTQQYFEAAISKNPEYKEKYDQIEEEIASFSNTFYKTQSTITIPVVFHVVYNTAAENISDSRLIEQLNVLNKDFRKLNSDTVNIPSVWKSLAADCEIEFILAMYDPNGNPTNGITRTNTSSTSFTNNDLVKYSSLGGHDIWNAQYYLNIWVCDLASPTLGYAQFPGGGTATDGVVIDYAVTGLTGSSAPFNLGRTATHEVAHWLNLRHIWGDDGDGSTTTPPSCIGSDNINDTPNQGDQNTGTITPGTIKISCANGPNGDMWMNYMDYTDDVSMCMFTQDQKTRMLATLSGIRSTLLSSPAIGINESERKIFKASCFPNPSSDGIFKIETYGGDINSIAVYDLTGKCVLKNDVIRNEKVFLINLSEFNSGIYTLNLVSNQNSFFTKLVISK
jgi:hypothetical protein